jgi:hypothetical protein
MRLTMPIRPLTALTFTVNLTPLPSITAGLETGVKMMVKSGVPMIVESLPELGAESPPETLT